jgi:hypothetical protein
VTEHCLRTSMRSLGDTAREKRPKAAVMDVITENNQAAEV